MSDFTYIAADGNYGDATGLVFVGRTFNGFDINPSLEDDSEVAEAAESFGINSIWVVTVEHTGGEPADVTVHATEEEANDSLVTNYLDGEERDEDDDLIYDLHMQGLTVQITSFPIPQVS